MWVVLLRRKELSHTHRSNSARLGNTRLPKIEPGHRAVSRAAFCPQARSTWLIHKAVNQALSALVVRQAMKYFKAMKREDIIRDIHGLDTELAALEEQYGLLNGTSVRRGNSASKSSSLRSCSN